MTESDTVVSYARVVIIRLPDGGDVYTIHDRNMRVPIDGKEAGDCGWEGGSRVEQEKNSESDMKLKMIGPTCRALPILIGLSMSSFAPSHLVE